MSSFKDVSAQASRRTNQLITNNTLTKVTGLVAMWGGLYLVNDTYTLPATGRYLIWAKMVSAKVAEGYREMWVKWTKPSGGGVFWPIKQVFAAQTGAAPPDPPTAEDDKTIKAVAGGTLELYVKQITGGNLNMLADNNPTIGFEYYNVSMLIGFQQVG